MWRFLTKLALELPYDPAIPLLGIHTEALGFSSSDVTNRDEEDAVGHWARSGEAK